MDPKRQFQNGLCRCSVVVPLLSAILKRVGPLGGLDTSFHWRHHSQGFHRNGLFYSPMFLLRKGALPLVGPALTSTSRLIRQGSKPIWNRPEGDFQEQRALVHTLSIGSHDWDNIRRTRFFSMDWVGSPMMLLLGTKAP